MKMDVRTGYKSPVVNPKPVDQPLDWTDYTAAVVVILFVAGILAIVVVAIIRSLL